MASFQKFRLICLLIPFLLFVVNALPKIAIVNPSSGYEEDILLSYSVNDVLSNYGMSPIFFENFPSDVLQKNFNFHGLVEIGNCTTISHFNSKSTNGSHLAYLILANEDCEAGKKLQRNIVPLFMANDYRKYSCVSHVIGMWLKNNLSSASLRLKKTSQSSENFRENFLACVENAFLTYKIRSKQEADRGKAYLNNRKVLIVTINRPPFLIFTFGGKDGQEIVTWEGYCIDMLNYLAGKFNFSYKLILPPDGNWGAPTPNGTFNGMVGMVQRHEVDFAIASFTITHIREQVIDFPHRFYEDPTTILIPPPIEKQNLFAFLSPFHATTWCYIAIGILGTAFFLWVFSTYPKGLRTFLYPYYDEHFLHSKNNGFFRYLWETCFVLVAQGTRLKQTDASRVLLGFWWAFGLILILSYTGTLIAFLTVPTMENLIDSLEELSNQREILWTYRANTAYDHLFGKAKPPGTYYQIGQLLHESPDLKVDSDEEGVNVVLYKKMAYIKEKSWLDFAMEADFLKTGKCRLSQVPQTFFSAGFGWALQEGSPYLDLFNDIFLRMRQTGLFEYWKKRYWPKPNKCTAGRAFATRGPRALSLVDLVGHFLILGSGCTLAILLFVAELIFYKTV